MAQPNAQPNAQNSELDPKKHPSGARIEKMMTDEKAKPNPSEKGMYGETLRPSERDDDDAFIEDVSTEDVHRRSPSNRQK
jgi:hypothetical protein